MNRATNLDALAAAMRSHAPWTLDEHGQWSSGLPTFGGEPVHEPGVRSWDRDRLLYGTCAEDLAIVPRVTVDLVNPWSGARVERDVSLLTEEQLHAMAQVFDRDVMEAVNSQTSADTPRPGSGLPGTSTVLARSGPACRLLEGRAMAELFPRVDSSPGRSHGSGADHARHQRPAVDA